MKLKFKHSLLVMLSLLSFGYANAQSQIIKLDSENGSFKNFPILPDNEVFAIEGEIDKSIKLVEIAISEEKSGKDPVLYSWNRSLNNNSESFSVIITQPLKAGATYDFTITTFKSLETEAKKKILGNILIRSHHLIQSEVILKKNEIRVNDTKGLIKGLNEIAHQGIALQRSRNGIEFNGLSGLVESEIKKLNKLKIKNLMRKRKTIEKDSISVAALNKKIDYLTELILTEIKPFISSELVEQYRKYVITEVKTRKGNFTLPINGGLYAWNLNSNINNVSFSNTGLTPGVGFTLPFKRSFSVKGKSISSLGLSLGVLTNKLEDGNGDRYGTPTINLPVYGALGVNIFRVIRVNAGVLMVSNLDNPTNKLKFLPTFGIALELDAWIGVRK
ncbi:hypothetical protein DIT68_11085 [Brumimicrobium oceani]|uniref:Uncharacterized protein n=2 Tax=Brumimicrobium oceani TaxID=2100725 RepID=A0A2U2XBL0_9FLAO|nr:hypothetical protein DIT68_11085 [Brumimicrobium oceani]